MNLKDETFYAIRLGLRYVRAYEYDYLDGEVLDTCKDIQAAKKYTRKYEAEKTAVDIGGSLIEIKTTYTAL